MIQPDEPLPFSYCEKCLAEHPDGDEHHWRPSGKVPRPKESIGSWPQCPARFNESVHAHFQCIFTTHGRACAHMCNPTGEPEDRIWWA